MSGALLKLRAGDAEDVQVISAVLQDSIVPVCDMVYQPENGAFVFVAQRLRREAGAENAAERICCALTIRGVTAAQTHGIDLHAHDRILDLLAIMVKAPAAGAPASLSLIFAGNAQIRLDLGDWLALAEDFGEAWPALCAPCHENAS